jgi:hypothetical protein
MLQVSEIFQYPGRTLSRATNIDEKVVCLIAKGSIDFG